MYCVVFRSSAAYTLLSSAPQPRFATTPRPVLTSPLPDTKIQPLIQRQEAIQLARWIRNYWPIFCPCFSENVRLPKCCLSVFTVEPILKTVFSHQKGFHEKNKSFSCTTGTVPVKLILPSLIKYC